VKNIFKHLIIAISVERNPLTVHNESDIHRLREYTLSTELASSVLVIYMRYKAKLNKTYRALLFL